MKVLLVGESWGPRSVLETAVDKRGHQVARCDSPSEALQTAGRNAFDLVIIDGRSSLSRGLELCRQLRGLPGSEYLHILVVSRGSGEELRRALEAGANDHLPEPLTVYSVEARLEVAEQHVVSLRASQRAEQALRASEARYRLLLDSTPDAILIAELGSWSLHYVNPAMCRLLGYEPEDLVRLTVRHIHPANAVGAVLDELELFLKEVTWRAPVLPCLRQDGEVVWTEVNATPVEYDRVPCLMGFYRDVTGRVRAEEAVRRAHEELEARVVERTAELAAANRGLRSEIEQRQRAQEELGRLKEFSEGILNSMGEGVILSDLDDRIMFANRAAADILGRVREEVVGACWLQAVPEDQIPVIQAAGVRRAQGKSDLYELELLHHGGERVPVLVSGTPMLDEGRLVGSLAVFTNLTERRRAEAERVLLSAAIEQAAESVVITDTEGAVRYVNRAFERTVGVSRAAALGLLPWRLFLGPPDQDQVRAMRQTVSQGRVWSGLVRGTGDDGAPFDLDSTVFPVRDSAGRTVNYVGLLRDVTAEKTLQRQLWQAQKMEEIGKVAGGIAHDFNNLLMVIVGTAELLQRRMPGDDALQRQIDVVLRTSRSAADLTRSLLDFSRQQVLEAADLDLNQLVVGMLPLLRRVIPENISLEHVAGRELGNVRADRGRLEQVLMNLCVNSRDAMPNGGSLVIETGDQLVDEDYARTHPWAQVGAHVSMTVTDSGCGMDEETVAQVFKPFFTTKQRGKGTGLGMASVYGIVKQHGGMIDIASTPGQGTTVRVLLPRVEPEGKVAAVAVEERPVRGGTETLLVVDDHEDLRRVLADYLQSLGYRVLTAGDGVEALEVLVRTREEVRLVISDMSMPRMNGLELYRSSRQLKPKLAFLFCTGYAPEWEDLGAGEDELTARIDKPCDIDVLGRKVRELLGRLQGGDAGRGP